MNDPYYKRKKMVGQLLTEEDAQKIKLELGFKTRTKPMVPPDKETLRSLVGDFYTTLPDPFYMGDGVVWLSMSQGDEDPYYALYNFGTNDLKIFEYKGGKWTQITVEDIENLYGFMWKFGLSYQGLHETRAASQQQAPQTIEDGNVPEKR